MLLDKQKNVSAQFPMPVDLLDGSTRVTNVTGETVSFIVASTNVASSGEVAGTVVYARLTNRGVTDLMKARIGYAGNSSFAFVTGTCLTTQRNIAFQRLEDAYAELSTLNEIALSVTEGFANGEFFLDHRSGIIFGVKATTANSDTAGYSYRSSFSDIEVAVEQSSPTGIGHGNKTVTTAGTDVALASSTTCKSVAIQAFSTNTGVIAVGASGVDANVATGTGVALSAGETYLFDIDNLADVFIDSTVSGEGVRYTYFT